MAQQFRPSIAAAEEEAFIPSTHIQWFMTACNSTRFCPPQAPGTWHTLTKLYTFFFIKETDYDNQVHSLACRAKLSHPGQ